MRGKDIKRTVEQQKDRQGDLLDFENSVFGEPPRGIGQTHIP